jgi:predicted nucleic acid-binding protein
VQVQRQSHLPRIASHPEDDFVLATVIKGRADILVTGDRQLRKLAALGPARIVSQAEMLKLLASANDD